VNTLEMTCRSVRHFGERVAVRREDLTVTSGSAIRFTLSRTGT
jgi:hypothetical protein